MNKIVDKLTKAQQYAISIRPKAGGFPVFAEVLRQAGVKINRWFLPSCQSIYGPVVNKEEGRISSRI